MIAGASDAGRGDEILANEPGGLIMPTHRPHAIRSSPTIEPHADGSSAEALDIRIDERGGMVEIRDPRAFRSGRRGFCRRLLEAALEHPDIREAEIDLVDARCRAAFEPRTSTARAMSEAIANAIHSAAAHPAHDRTAWWRRPEDWSALTARRSSEGVSWWEIMNVEPGQVRIHHPALSNDRARAIQRADALSDSDGVESSHLSMRSRTLTLRLRPGTPLDERFRDEIEQEMATSTLTFPVKPHQPPVDDVVEVATGLRRLRYLTLAGGALVLTMVGLVVPGIPTVPFLLATGYFLARSSPRLNAALRSAPILGSILVEWEEHHGVSHTSKLKMMEMTAVIVLITVAVSVGSPITLVVVLVLAIISMIGIVQMPGLPGDRSSTSIPSRTPQLALHTP